MNKAFLFDMDGVLVDSEPVWEELEREYLPKIFGPAVAAKMPDLIGAGLAGVLETATSLGAVYDRAKAIEQYDEIARQVYERSPVTNGVDVLVERLATLGFELALVSQSPHSWIDRVMPRLPFGNKFTEVVSLNEHPELKRKPAPDGYLYACRQLDTKPTNSIVLEDSNYGIQSGKTAGCFVIGYRGNLVAGYGQTGADAYADTMEDVMKLAEEFTRR